MAKVTSIKQRLQDFGGFAVESLQAEIVKQGLTDTGNLSRSLQSEVEVGENLTTLSVSGAAYIVSLDRGAAPIKQQTTGQFVDSIKAWAERKLGMDPKESLGFAIAYMKRRAGENPNGNWTTTDSIGNYVVPNRYNPGNLIANSITDAAVNELMGDLVKLAGEEIKEKIRIVLK